MTDWGLKLGETQGEQALHAHNVIDFVTTHKQNVNGPTCPNLKFKQGLATHATRRARIFDKVAVLKCSDSYCRECHAGIVGACIEASTALGTDAYRESCIFLIGAFNHHAIFKQNGRPHIEVAIGGVATLGGFFGKVNQLLVLTAQLIVSKNLYLCRDIFLCHEAKKLSIIQIYS